MSTEALTTTKNGLSMEPSSSSQAACSSSASTTATKPIVTESGELNVNASSSFSISHLPLNPAPCHYFARGVCRFGSMCRFSHDLNIEDGGKNFNIPHERPSTSHRSWVNAPVFIPESNLCGGEILNTNTKRSWADVVGTTSARASAGNSAENLLNANRAGSANEICPFEGPCPYGVYCLYPIHLELCEMCDHFCLNPHDDAQRKMHKKECLQQHEQAMELSFAVARSKDKTCGICFDTIMEKARHEKRFGILPNCNHIFCLECIRKWRQAKNFEHKITRSCPECRVASDFVCPSSFWVETKDEKDKLLGDYRKALCIKDCKYFKKGKGKCPFGNKCFYKHALSNGDLVDVGCPKKARKINRSNNELIDLLDIYLYEFIDSRDFSEDMRSISEESSTDDDYIEVQI